VDHAVESARCCDDVGHRGGDGRGIEHVGTPVAESRAAESRRCVVGEVHPDDLRSLGQQPLHGGGADAGSRSGDQDALVPQPIHVLLLSAAISRNLTLAIV
jgi:hypothetical protein